MGVRVPPLAVEGIQPKPIQSRPLIQRAEPRHGNGRNQQRARSRCSPRRGIEVRSRRSQPDRAKAPHRDPSRTRARRIRAGSRSDVAAEPASRAFALVACRGPMHRARLRRGRSQPGHDKSRPRRLWLERDHGRKTRRRRPVRARPRAAARTRGASLFGARSRFVPPLRSRRHHGSRGSTPDGRDHDATTSTKVLEQLRLRYARARPGRGSSRCRARRLRDRHIAAEVDGRAFRSSASSRRPSRSPAGSFRAAIDERLAIARVGETFTVDAPAARGILAELADKTMHYRVTVKLDRGARPARARRRVREGSRRLRDPRRAARPDPRAARARGARRRADAVVRETRGRPACSIVSPIECPVDGRAPHRGRCCASSSSSSHVAWPPARESRPRGRGAREARAARRARRYARHSCLTPLARPARRSRSATRSSPSRSVGSLSRAREAPRSAARALRGRART